VEVTASTNLPLKARHDRQGRLIKTPERLDISACRPVLEPFALEAVGTGEEQLRDPAHPTSGANRRVQLVNIGKKFCFGRSGEQFSCQ
jgi:hypothetical protein